MSMKIGVDVGYGNTKIVSSNGDGKLEGKFFRSIVGQSAQVTNSLDVGFANEIIAVDWAGETYLLGATAEQHSSRILNSRDKSWITTPAYRALVKKALLMAIEGKNASGMNQIVTGLPVKYFNSDKDKVAQAFKEVTANIGMQADVKVVYQPIGTYMNTILDDGGNVYDHSRSDLHGRIGVFDIGFYTADLVTIEKRQVTESLSISVESGVSTVLEAIKKEIEESSEFGCRQTTVYEVEDAIRHGFRIKVFGTEKSIREIAIKRLREFTAELTSKAHSVWHNGADLDKVILTGGGAEILEHSWNLYPHAQIIRSASLSNATGYCKYAARICERSAQ